ncbi:MAG: hypothetical protein FJ102_19175 [Deltaproteobacteria bacterium]|nr:hypothetical protein [Deltaproteobacteria bacterium]
MSRRALLVAAAGYGALAVGLTWPAAVQPLTAVPGGARTDTADSLWTLWYVARELAAGRLAGSVDGLLNHPAGGSLWPADAVDALVGAPLVWLAGAAPAWSLLCILHLATAGLAAHLLAERLGGRGVVGGVLYAASAMSIAHVQNGASEAVLGTSLLPLAALGLLACARGGGPLFPGLLLGVAALGHAYTGVLAYLLGAAVLAVGLPGATPGFRKRVALAMIVGLLVAAGPSALALSAATADDNVVGIKTARELMTIRRTIGPADPEVFVRPGDFRSPDFRELSRYGEDLVHCAYLGGIGVVGALASLRRRATPWAMLLAGGLALLLSLGPVLVENGAPVILSGRRAIPLPYLLVESLPGFSSLSLLWRLAQLGSLAVAVLAARAVERPLLAWAMAALGLAETLLASPVAGFPRHFDASVGEGIHVLADAPPGAVMNFPVVGARAYLWEQSVHQKPLTGTLNFPNNNAARKVWKVAIEHEKAAPAAMKEAVVSAARAADVRYLVVHVDARAFDDDMHTGAVRAIKAAFEPMHESPSMRVYRFW